MMKQTLALPVLAYWLLWQAVTWSRVKGQQCPPGQIAHPGDQKGTVICCYPVMDCDPNHFLEYCKHNGESDKCVSCPRGFALYKRTSSFAVEDCHPLTLDPKTCQDLPGSLKASEEELAHCYCKLEEGFYYMKPEVPIPMLIASCQPLYPCNPGFEPKHNAQCHPCPKNTVQTKPDSHRFCRPQKNCTALGLEVLVQGNASIETVCSDPPDLPAITPGEQPQTTTPVTLSTKKKSATTTATTTTTPGDGDAADVSVRPSRADSSGENNVYIIVVAVLCSVLLFGLLGFVIYRRHHLKRLCMKATNCHGGNDPEAVSYQATQRNMGSGDNDNTSDNSCCACADSCLSAPSSKGASGSSVGASASGYAKNSSGGPLDAYSNSKMSPSEPLYNSLCHDGAVYKNVNVNGVAPTLLRQDDFYNYPTKVCLPTTDDEDENSLKKGPKPYYLSDPARGHSAGEESRETDPLLPGSEHASPGVPTPLAAQGLRGILRNGPSHQEPRGQAIDGENRRGGGQGGPVEVVGNRPNLSMLLSESSVSSVLPQNLPFLSQLVSQSVPAASSQPSPHLPPTPALQQQEHPEQLTHDLPLQLQQLLQQQQQQQQEVPTLPVRLVQVPNLTHPQPNPNLVQMDELKPVVPRNPSPLNPEPPAIPPNGRLGQWQVKTPSGLQAVAENVQEKGRSGSPARINPSQQEELRRPARPPNISPAVTTGGSGSSAKGAAFAPSKGEKDINEETFQKQPMPGVASTGTEGEDDETAHKSVGGSSGLGDSLDISPLSMPPEEGRRSRTPYRRSVSEVSRSVSPSLPAPPSRSISSPEEKHRPFAVVKPMRSDQSLNRMYSSQDPLVEPLDNAQHHFPLQSLASNTPLRQSSQDSSDDAQPSESTSDERTQGHSSDHSDSEQSEHEDDSSPNGKNKSSGLDDG